MTQRQLLDRGLTTVALLGILAAGSLMPSAVADEGPHIMPTETPPAGMGVSGGNINHSAMVDDNLVCRTGTLGLQVKDASFHYILSANHVLARLNQAPLGEAIIQPGLVDTDPSRLVCWHDVWSFIGDCARHQTTGRQNSQKGNSS